MKPRRQAFAMLAASLLALSMTTGCVVIPLNSVLDDSFQEVEARAAKSKHTRDKVLMLDVTGTIDLQSQGLFAESESTVQRLKESLRMAADDPKIKALVIRIDSPGGGVTASDLCYHEVRKFQNEMAKRRDRKMPVVAVMMDTAASGGYFIAMAADEVWAHPTTITGSIGVVAVLPEISGLAKSIGVNAQIVKSGKMKDAGSIWREMTKDERATLQEIIDGLYDHFLDVVARGRPGLDKEAVRELADGRVFTARQALEAKLIDHVGYLDEAIDSAIGLAGVEDASVVTYTRRRSLVHSIYSTQASARAGQATAPTFHIDLGGWTSQGGARFYYLWKPVW